MLRLPAALVFLYGASVQAEPVSLAALIAEARARSPTVEAARARLRAARSAIDAAGWPEDPMLRLEGDDVRGGGQGEQGPMLRAMLEQALPVPGALALEERVADAAAERAGHDLVTAQRDVELAITRAFLMLRMVDGALDVNASQRQLVEDLVQSALGRLRSGADTHHDVLQSQVELLSLDTERMTLEAERTAALGMVNALRDRPPATPLTAGDVGPLPETLPPAAALESFAVGHRAELRSMRAMAREDRAMAAWMRREAWPMLRVGLWYSHDLQMPGSVGAMVSANLPVFGVPRQTARAAEAEQRALSIEAERTAMLAMVRARVRAARQRYLAMVRRESLVRDVAIPRAGEALAAAQVSYRAGMMPFASVVQDRRMLAELRMDLVRAETDRALAFAEVLRELGAGSWREVAP